MRKLLLYVDASVIGGCEDPEFADDSLALWRLFISGISSTWARYGSSAL